MRSPRWNACSKEACKPHRVGLRRLFDHLVGAGKDRHRHRQTERLCCLEIGHQLEDGFRSLMGTGVDGQAFCVHVPAGPVMEARNGDR
jgi:hypothetical protein